MQNEREYYIAGGADLEKLKDFIDKRSVAFKHMAETAKKHGGKVAHNGVRIIGLVFEGNAPVGWTPRGSVREGKFYLPKRDSAERKAVAKDIDSVRLPGASELHSQLSNDGGVMKDDGGRGMRILYISYEMLGDKLLLTVPTGCAFTPDGSEPLKMSEYWALKEQIAA